MASLRKDVLDALGLRGQSGTLPIGPGVAIDEYLLTLPRWRGGHEARMSVDCNKRGGLVRAADGSLSCTEVEVVRRIRARHPSLSVGWVQAWPCGRDSWAEWIHTTLPTELARRNALVQTALGVGATKLGGHPDVAVLDGDTAFYIECKTTDPIAKQVAWIPKAMELDVIGPADVIVVRAVIT